MSKHTCILYHIFIAQYSLTVFLEISTINFVFPAFIFFSHIQNTDEPTIWLKEGKRHLLESFSHIHWTENMVSVTQCIFHSILWCKVADVEMNDKTEKIMIIILMKQHISRFFAKNQNRKMFLLFNNLHKIHAKIENEKICVCSVCWQFYLLYYYYIFPLNACNNKMVFDSLIRARCKRKMVFV